MSNAVLARGRAVQPLGRGIGALRDFSIDLAILLVSYLVATYFRRELPFGKYVGTNYRWQGLELYVTLAAALALVYALSLVIDPSHRGATSRFWTAVGGVAASCVGLTIFVPLQSGLEKGYFAFCALLLIALIVPWPGSAQRMLGRPTLMESLNRLWANRSLLQIWVRYNVRSRYAQAFLGIFWIALLPLSTAFVMSVVFSQIMRIHISNVPFIAFFLAGFVPWGLFSQSISASMRSILGSMGLINQIYFPREIIVLSALGEALVDAFFMFIALVVIDAIVGVYPNGLWVVLPLLVLIQIVFSLGLMLIISWLSVLVRDIPQLVSVVLQILFYLSPIIYPVSIIPHRYQFLVTLNPISVLIEAYHRIIVYGQPPDWSSLFYPAAFGIALLVFGYRLFKTNEDRMADMV